MAEAPGPLRLDGWFVVEAGKRQTWPFLGFADPSTDQELRLYLDTDFALLPRFDGLDQDDGRALEALDSVMGATVTRAGTDGGSLN